MHLSFLGIGSAYNTAWGNTNAYFHHGDDLCLLDCGEGAFAALRRRRLPDDCHGKIVVLLTHCHADHVGSLASLCSYAYYRLGKMVHVVHPDNQVMELLRLMGIPTVQYHYHEELGMLLPGLDACALPVVHTPDIPAYGYLLRQGNVALYYSGDAGSIPELVLAMLKDGALERMYQDTCWQQRDLPPNGHHMTLYQLEELIPPHLRSKVYLMHFNRDYRTEAMQMGFSCAEPDGLFTTEE